jgi:ribonuclease-3
VIPPFIPFIESLTGQTPTHPELFEQALTHRSASGNNNERLEFLGDALLGLVIADALWHQFPVANEGELSRGRATLVKKESLAEQARALGLGDYLRLGSGELRTGGYARDSILADAFEALLGAVYLDQGIQVAEQLILRLFADQLHGLGQQSPVKDPKTRLQEYLQAQHLGLPEYEVVAITGKQHNQHFVVCCRLPNGEQETIGEGTSRRRAEQLAATNMLAILEHAATDDRRIKKAVG